LASFTRAHRGGEGPPLLCLHGFTDTWRTWELVLPALEREREVLAPTLAGHAGGPAFESTPSDEGLADALETYLDEAGFAAVDIVGNSLGGYMGLKLAERGRARSVVALAPAGGWESDAGFREAYDYFIGALKLLESAAPYADAIASTPEGRRRATEFITANYEHIPADLIAHQIAGAAACGAAQALLDYGIENGWKLKPERIDCPIRIVWGTNDRILPWPGAAAKFREWFPTADWIELDGIGHCPQLDVPTEVAELVLGFSRA
jgi:pimeloyl-ACP methyl ester carboxylesterase